MKNAVIYIFQIFANTDQTAGKVVWSQPVEKVSLLADFFDRLDH